MAHTNHLGQPIGYAVPNWMPPPFPERIALVGHYCRVEPLHPDRHAADLFAANSLDTEGAMWTYLGVGPFASLDEYRAWIEHVYQADDPQFYAIIDHASEQAVGVAAFLRIAPAQGSIEVGHIAYSPRLQRTPAATEAMFLMMRRAFELGYRRYEWKCDVLNARSREAAQRYGLSFEGVFRHALVYKGRNRDTAWFAAIDTEWPELRAAFRRWLDPANFDMEGNQIVPLRHLTAPILKRRYEP
jgi:RimJ/RimL family protein N-acetyltransferase